MDSNEPDEALEAPAPANDAYTMEGFFAVFEDGRRLHVNSKEFRALKGDKGRKKKSGRPIGRPRKVQREPAQPQTDDAGDAPAPGPVSFESLFPSDSKSKGKRAAQQMDASPLFAMGASFLFQSIQVLDPVYHEHNGVQHPIWPLNQDEAKDIGKAANVWLQQADAGQRNKLKKWIEKNAGAILLAGAVGKATIPRVTFSYQMKVAQKNARTLAQREAASRNGRFGPIGVPSPPPAAGDAATNGRGSDAVRATVPDVEAHVAGSDSANDGGLNIPIDRIPKASDN